MKKNGGEMWGQILLCPTEGGGGARRRWQDHPRRGDGDDATVTWDLHHIGRWDNYFEVMLASIDLWD